MSRSPLPLVTDDDIKRMAREAERLNALLPVLDRRPRGWYFRQAAIRLGVMPLAEMSADELAWYLSTVVLTRARS